MLLAGRPDAFPMDKVVAFDMLHSQFSREERQRLSFHPLPLRSDSLHLLLSKQAPGTPSAWRASIPASRPCRTAARSASTCWKSSNH